MFSNLHDYRISRFFFVHCTKWRNSDFTPCHTPMTQFFWTSHAVPRNPKNFWKIGGYLLIWSMPWALSGLKIKPMQLPPHRTVHGFNHMTFIYLLLCWNIFQHALLKALFHNIVMTTLIERVRTFLYMTTPTYIGSYAFDHVFMWCIVFLDHDPRPHKKRRLPRPYMYIFYSLLTISYKTKRKH